MVKIYKGASMDPRTVESVRFFKRGCMDPRTAKSVKLFRNHAGIHGQPIWSEFLKGGEGIHECKNKPQVGHLAERVVRIRENRHIIHIKTSTV